jgi:CRP/FNR family transcriptional regulator, cyclic AMP receptor protein
VNDPKKTLWHLRKMPVLNSVDPTALTLFADRVQLRESKRKEVFYLPGDPSETVYMVHAGRIKISKVTRDGKSLTLAYCGPTELFGELCLADPSPRTEMAETIDNATVGECHRKDFEELCLTNARLSFDITKMTMLRRRDLETKVEALIFKDVGGKLAEQLLKLAETHGIEDARGTLLAVKITHQDLANLIGATRETVSLTLSQFKKQNMIDSDGRRVIVTNPELLRALL